MEFSKTEIQIRSGLCFGRWIGDDLTRIIPAATPRGLAVAFGVEFQVMVLSSCRSWRSHSEGSEREGSSWCEIGRADRSLGPCFQGYLYAMIVGPGSCTL